MIFTLPGEVAVQVTQLFNGERRLSACRCAVGDLREQREVEVWVRQEVRERLGAVPTREAHRLPGVPINHRKDCAVSHIGEATCDLADRLLNQRQWDRRSLDLRLVPLQFPRDPMPSAFA